MPLSKSGGGANPKMIRTPSFSRRIPARRSFLFLGVLASFSLLAFDSLVLSCPPGQSESASPPPASQKESSALSSTADAVLEDVSRITGLPIRAPVVKEIVNRRNIEKYLKENLYAEYSPRELRVQEAVLKAFGLVPREFDLEKFLIVFYTEQAAGFYDPRLKKMFMADWISPDLQKVVLAHELTHALQDQNFGLEKFLRAAREDDDATGARQAIIEGYATAAMMQYLIQPARLTDLPSLQPLIDQVVHQQMAEFPAFSSAPFFFRFEALFPYSQGMTFIEQGLSQGGWGKLNTLFASPPSTTKEIFEPEVYFEKKSPPKVTLTRPTALDRDPGLSFLTENSLGELGYYALIGQFITEEEAKAVAPGWSGDRYVLYEGRTPGQYALVARSRWSSAETAQAFFRDVQAILRRRYSGLIVADGTSNKSSDTDVFIASTGPTRVVLLRRNNECSWAEGVPPESVDAVLGFLRSLRD